ncbi:MAG: HAMP domain-containing protein [Mycobacteriales bacterium]
MSGTWKDLTENVNFMAGNLTSQVRNIAQVTTAVARGDLSQKITVDARGEILELKNTINVMVDQLSAFAAEVTRVAREVGTEGKLGGQAEVKGVSGTWKDLTENVNFMASNLTSQVRSIAQVATAVARGDLSQKITVETRGEVAALAQTINTMVDTLSSFAAEVTRVAREVGTEGKLGGQADVEGVAGTWKDLTDNVNFMAGNLTNQVRNIAQVTTAVAQGDLSQKITVDARGEILELKDTINTMVDQLSSFADEVTRVAREVGTEGRLGGQAFVRGVSGTWKDLTDNVNFMASNLTDQVRSIAQVATAVARGDLSQKITVEAKGEVAALAGTINTMVDQLSYFAAEVTRVAREVGTGGVLGGQAVVPGVGGTWKDLTDNVNFMAGNLTSQVRSIAQVTTAVAKGDLSQKITVDARGEILELKNTINTMVDQLSSFAAEVTRVAREVGTEGILGGQAEVEGVSGTWKRLTESVNQLAANLTTQVRSIAEVSTAVTRGDLTRQIAVEALGEVAELSDNINQMIGNLRETTQRNEEQDWLKTNLARISGLMQGQRDLMAVSRLIMSELTPVVSAQHGAFFLAESGADEDVELRLIASYGYQARTSVSDRFRAGEALVGQAALEKKSILVTEAPADYIRITSGLGDAVPASIIVLPVLFEDQVLGVIELASFQHFSAVHQAFLDQLVETIGVTVNTIIANMRTEELLEQSQRLTQELQLQSEELQTQQEELRHSNSELEQQAASLKASEELLQAQQEEMQQTNAELQHKARLLQEQNSAIEVKNRQIEIARNTLEERAEQLAVSSKYKSEFLANMSHELRTPLNSLLILAKLLAENSDGNLTPKQIEFATTIHAAGSDLLQLISDILDLSKVEAGKMDIHPADVPLTKISDYVESGFGPVAQHKGLDFTVLVEDGIAPTIFTDEQRLQQVLKNLLSNALKFTERGGVTLRVFAATDSGVSFQTPALREAKDVIGFTVRDTGIGVADDKLKIIFEAFQQADGTTSRRFGGTGLGLSISREMSRLLGGEIQATSEVGAGSSFTLYLPARYAFRDNNQDNRELGMADLSDNAIRALDEAAAEAAAERAAEMEPAVLLAGSQFDDDRADVQPGDRVLLVVESNATLAKMAVDVGRDRGFKVLVALDGDTGFTTAREAEPDAIIAGIETTTADGESILGQLKRHHATRHIPVHVVSEVARRHEAMAAGALAVLQTPVTGESLAEALAEMSGFIDRRVRNLLIVEDDERERETIAELIGGGGDDVDITCAGTSEEALAALEEKRFDCMVLDLKLGDTSGFALLEKLKKDERFHGLPVIIYTGKELTRRDETRLRKYAETIIVKDARSPERLLDETALFLHRVESRLPAEKRRMIEQLHGDEGIFKGRKVLIVDDDVRNVFALTSALEVHGITIAYAENGREGIEVLRANPDVDLVLMDVMMPEMDGYATTQAIRKMPQFGRLPIIALTAKAMKGDRDKSIASGASDYITKPVDIDQLLSLMRVWLYK